MTGFGRLPFWVWVFSAHTILLALLGTASAQQDVDPERATAELKGCYRQQAKHYGLKTCAAPSRLVNAVFASCAEQEKALVTASTKDPRYSSLGYDNLKTAIDELKEEDFRPNIEKMIWDSRIDKGVCLGE